MALLEYVTKEAFAPFGTVIEHPDPSKGGFCVVEREEKIGRASCRERV